MFKEVGADADAPNGPPKALALPGPSWEGNPVGVGPSPPPIPVPSAFPVGLKAGTPEKALPVDPVGRANIVVLKGFAGPAKPVA